MAYKISQSKLKTLAITNWTLSKWPKFFNVVVKWRYFAKSGHTILNPFHLRCYFSQIQNPFLADVNVNDCFTFPAFRRRSIFCLIQFLEKRIFFHTYIPRQGV